jgi:hypothetical protein
MVIIESKCAKMSQKYTKNGSKWVLTVKMPFFEDFDGENAIFRAILR